MVVKTTAMIPPYFTTSPNSSIVIVLVERPRGALKASLTGGKQQSTFRHFLWDYRFTPQNFREKYCTFCVTAVVTADWNCVKRRTSSYDAFMLLLLLLTINFALKLKTFFEGSMPFLLMKEEFEYFTPTSLPDNKTPKSRQQCWDLHVFSAYLHRVS